MGQGNLKQSGGTNAPITSDLIDQFYSALERDLVPRAGGVATASAGSVGTEIYPFSAGYFDRIFIGDQEVATGGPGDGGNVGGPGSITAASTIRNGVVSGLEPAGRPGMSGWLHQAGSSGVVVSATSSDPLTVKLDSTTYTRESNITGGTLPADFAQAIVPVVADYGVSDAGGGTWAEESVRYFPMNADRSKFRYATGGTFAFHSTTGTEILPDNYGANICIKSTGAGDGSSAVYTYCQRVSNSASASGHRNLAKLFQRSVFNTSPTAQTYDNGDIFAHTNHKVIRCAPLFCDPLTSTWSLTIAPRIVGTVNTTLPGTTGYSTGEVIYRELDARYYRFSGTQWQRTSFVLLGFLAIDGGAVEAVMPITTENTLSAMFDKKLAVLGDSVSREGQVDGDLIRFGGQKSDVEEKSFPELRGQSYNQIGTSAVIDTSDNELGTLENGAMFSVYLDVEDNRYYFEQSAPVWIIYRQRLILAHSNRQRLFVGTFITDDSGTLIAAQSISDQGNRLNEGNDDAFRYANPCLFGRSKLADLGQPENRRFQVQLRGKGTRTSGTNTYRYRWRGTRQFWAGYHLNKQRYDELFFSYLTPHITEEIEFDTDNNPYLVVEFSQWDEGSLLHAAGLSEAAREGRARAIAGGASAAAGGSIASIDEPQIDTDAVGNRALSPAAVEPYNLLATNNVAAGLVSVVVDPDDPTSFFFQFGSSGGGGGTPDDGTIDWDKFASSVIANERDVLDPDSTDLKIISNLTMHDILEDIRAESAEFWTDWSSPSTLTITNTADNAVFSAGFLRVRNSASVNVKTVSLPTNGEALLCTTTCTGLPTIPNGTLRGVVLTEYEGTRWAYLVDNPETTSDIDFYYLDSSSVWQPVGYRGDELYTNFNGVLHNNRWAPMSAVAKNGAAGQGLGGGAYESISKWDNVSTGISMNIQYQMRIVYDTTDNQFKILLANRYFDLFRNTKVDADDINFAGTINNGDFLQKWTTTDVLGNSVDIIRGARPTLQTRVTLANYTGSGLTSTLTEQTTSGSQSFDNFQFVSFKFCNSQDSSTCYTTPLYATQDWTVGDEIGFTRPHSADADQIAVKRNSGNNKFQLSYRPTGATGLSLKAIYGYNF